MNLSFAGELFEWRGPAPFFFVRVPRHEAEMIKEVARSLTYGWGVIPIEVRIGTTSFTTSLFPKDGSFLVPIKAAVRKAERIELDDEVTLELHLDDERA